MKLKPYPKYKDSGVEWIGEIPEDWKIQRLKYLLASIESGSRERGGGNILDEGIFSLGGEHITWDGKLKLENLRFISEEHYNSMKNGKIRIKDVLLVKDGATIGKTAIVNKMKYKKMAVNEHVFILRSNQKVLPELLYYIVSSHSVFSQIKLTESGSAQGGIKKDFASKVIVTIPEKIKEQQKIVSFLNNKTSKIDLNIEKYNQFIELLKEKRAFLINHAVTKGLDPEIPMKDSGVEWIGEIPEEWKLRRLKYNASINPRGKKSLPDPQMKVNFLPMEKVSEDGDYDLESVNEYKNVSSGYTYFEDEDVLLAKITPCFENGKGALVENLKHGFGFGSTEFHVLRHGPHIYPKYLFFFTKTHLFRRIGKAFMKGAAGQKRVSTDFVKNFPMPTPPLTEQKLIVNYLDKETSKIDTIIKKIQQNIKLLKEYKKSLIHHVVTGKVDVREVEL